jgi:hypothetical protein
MAKTQHQKKENSIILIDRITTQILRDQSYLVDDHQIRQYEYYISALNQIKRSVLIDPRYPHQIVQNKIDDIHSRDKQIKGASVDLLFNEIKNNLENFNPNVRAIF